MDKRFIAVLVCAIIIFFSNLGGNSVYILDEAKNAGCAMEMAQRNDLVVPTFNGELRTDKPVLHYYFMMTAYKVLGVTPFAARFFSALCGVILILVVYRGVSRVIGSDAAFLTSLILLASVQLAVQFHLAVPDPYLILFTTVSLFAFFYGIQRDRRFLLLSYAAVALGALTKGLVAMALPGTTALLYLILTRQLTWPTTRKLHILPGLLIIAIIALPWYVAVWRATDGAWTRGFFIEHNFQRYTETMEGHGGFPLAPFAILIVALLPFSVFIVQAVKLSLKRRHDEPFLLFSMIACVVVGGFFSFSRTILPSYPAPAIPFLAVVLGYYFANLIKGEQNTRPGLTGCLVIISVLTLTLPIAAYFVLRMDPQTNGLTFLPSIFIVLPIGAAFAWMYYRRDNLAAMTYSWAISWMALTLLFFYYANPVLDKINPVTESLPVINNLGKTHKVVAYKVFNPAFVFQLKHTIPVLQTPEELKLILDAKEPVMVLTRYKYLETIPNRDSLKIVYRQRDLFERSETVILSN